jgi:hypothetical protein
MKLNLSEEWYMEAAASEEGLNVTAGISKIDPHWFGITPIQAADKTEAERSSAICKVHQPAVPIPSTHNESVSGADKDQSDRAFNKE